MLNFKVDYTSAKKVQDALRGLEEALGPREQNQILKKIAVQYLAETEKRFGSQSDPDRKKWKPLKPSTVKMKQRKGSLSEFFKNDTAKIEPTHIGVWTGKLVSSLQYRISGDTVTIGSDVPYASWFHYGHKKGWGPTPSRRFLGRNTRIDEKILRIYENEIMKRIGLSVQNTESAV